MPKPPISFIFSIGGGSFFALWEDMRTLAVKLLFTLMLTPGLLWAAGTADYCQKPVVELQNSGSKLTHPQLSGRIYQRAFLKLAQRLSLENLSTLEAYANTLGARLTEAQKTAFAETYARYAQAETYDAFIKSLKVTDYWKPQLRLNNAHVAMVAALAREMGEIRFSESDIAVLWLSQTWPDSEALSISKQLALLSGATEKKRHLSVMEFQALLQGLRIPCDNLNDAELHTQLRKDFWTAMAHNRQGHFQNRKVTLAGDTFSEIPGLQTPDQTLRLGEPLQINGRTYQEESFRSYFTLRHQINAAGNLQVIKKFHELYGDASFVVLDKPRKTLTLFNSQGNELTSAPAEIFPGDELNSGGAGIYFHRSQKQGYHYLQSERDLQIRAAFKSTLQIPEGTAVYVLPETKDHRFRIRNHRLTFGAAKVHRNRVAYNYSPLNRDFKKIRVSLQQQDSFTHAYTQALQDEKATLMGILRIEDDEYNMLAEFAFGVLSPETNYGKNWKYKVKELAPVLVSLLKGNGFDTDENSRGPTQIKRIPEAIVEKYSMTKSDLRDPRSAAVATLAFSADLLRDLRNIAYQHPEITEENIQNYLYYLYQGRRWEIRDATATPEKNASIRKIRSAIELLKIQPI